MQKYKATGHLTLFDEEERQQRLSKIGNPLDKLSKVIDFEMFRNELEDAVLNKEKKSRAGAKPYDVVMMFKIMVIQRYYNLSDDQTEYQIEDRQSFRRFLGLSSGDKVPDAKTIWLFREKLVKSGASEVLFQKFVNFLNSKNMAFNEGRMVDASFVLAPHDSQSLDNLLTEKDRSQELFADSAYVGQEETLEKYEVKDRICEKGYRDHPLTKEQMESNRLKSKTRSRVEHVSGFMECVMNKLFVRTIGLARAAVITGMINLVYNMCRYEQIIRLGLLQPEKV